MDIISFNEAATANSRIEICNANPDSTSGIVTVPKVIASGETITIPAGRVAILPNVQIGGVLNVEGEVFIPSGSTLSTVVEKVTSTDNAIVRFKGVTGAVQNSGVIIDDNGTLLLTSGTGGLGYGTGAGGNVTQLTSKSTAVLLNKPTGFISMSIGSLAAGASATFTFNNSLLSGADTLNIVIYSDSIATQGSYRLTWSIKQSLAYITLTNQSASALNEAPLLNFTITKGANS